jgi:serine/threonine protein kinase
MAQPQAQVQPCRYKTGKTLGAGSYSVVKECVHIDTGRYYAAKVINKRLMAGREHMVRNEIAVLKRVSMGHQNILTLVDYFETMNNRKIACQPVIPRFILTSTQCTSSPTSPSAANSSTASAARAPTSSPMPQT